MLYSINWPNVFVWLPLLCEILGSMYMQLFVNQVDAISFKINRIFLIKPFLYMTQKSRQKLKNLEKEKSF